MSDDQLSLEPHTRSISHTYRCIIRVETIAEQWRTVSPFQQPYYFTSGGKLPSRQTTCQAPWGAHSPCLHSLFLPCLLASPPRVLSCLNSWVRLTLADISSSSEPRLLLPQKSRFITPKCAPPVCLPPPCHLATATSHHYGTSLSGKR